MSNFRYELREDNTAVVTGWDSPFETLDLPDMVDGCPVRGIGNRAFAGDERLRRIILPEGIEFIGDSAFAGCKNVQYVLLPASVSRFGNDWKPTPYAVGIVRNYSCPAANEYSRMRSMLLVWPGHIDDDMEKRVAKMRARHGRRATLFAVIFSLFLMSGLTMFVGLCTKDSTMLWSGEVMTLLTLSIILFIIKSDRK